MVIALSLVLASWPPAGEGGVASFRAACLLPDMVRLFVKGVAELLVDLLLEVLAGRLIVLLGFQLFADRLQELVG